MRRLVNRFGVALILLTASAAHAQSFAGVWKTYGDGGVAPESLVRIEDAGGIVTGTVIRVFAPPANSADPRCSACRPPLKDMPIVGMKILKAKPTGEGEILDPDEGRVYRCTLKLLAGGAKLEVRGYIGVPMFGRTQVWLRLE